MDMNNGCLYFYNDPKMSMLQKVECAKRDFSIKFNHVPEYCLVNAGDAETNDLNAISKATGLIVKPYKFIMPHNFWVGFEGMSMSVEK